MGLLLAHKRKLLLNFDILSLSHLEQSERVGGGERGEIEVFSNDSRFRLFKLLHQIKFQKVTFCTLTYPLKFPTDSKIYKAHLKEYRRRFEILYGAIPAVWRLEFQKRGAPHYHIMYLDCPYIKIKDWSNLWAEVVHSGSPAHHRNGVHVKLITSRSNGRLVASYLAKYVAKQDKRSGLEVTQKPGRWWGKWNIEENKPTEIEVYDYEARELVKYLLSLKKDNKWAPMDDTLCTVMGDNMGTDEFYNLVIKFIKNMRNIG